MCKVILKGRWQEPLEIKCSGLTEEQVKTCEAELNTLANVTGIINICDSDIKYMQNGRMMKALYEICGDDWKEIFAAMDKAFIECKAKYKNLATIISFSGQFGDEPIFELIDNYFTHCSEDKILTDMPTEFGMYIKEYGDFSVKATVIIFAE